MYIHGVVERTRANGPGLRSAVWFQGCTLGCAGCWNPNTHEHGIGETISAKDLADRLLATEGIEGITFSGGEPMQQAFDLLLVATRLKTSGRDISLGMYSGYTKKELLEGRYETFHRSTSLSSRRMIARDIITLLDFAVLGRYNQLQTTKDLPLRGSANQELLLPTGRYTEADFRRQFVEITIKAGGSASTLTGFPVGIHKRIDEAL